MLEPLLDHPVVTLSRIAFGPFLFNEGLIERQVMSDTVLPSIV